MNLELARCRLHLALVPEVTWNKESTVQAESYNVSYGEPNKNHQFGTGFLEQGILSSVKKAEFVNDKLLCVVLKSRCCDIITLNALSPVEEKVVIQRHF